MLKLKNINKLYTDKKVLDNINLNFREHEFVMILGPSGSGKTTLLNIIGGLDNNYDGEVLLYNKTTKNYKESTWDYYRNSNVGFIFQNYNLINHISVFKNIELPLCLNNISKNKRKNRVKNILKDLEMIEYINKKPNELSGGQMQKIAIARALINDPKIILADEPTGALDSLNSIKIMKILKNISKDKLIIMVTHNEELALKYADRIIKIKDGKIQKDSKPLINEYENKSIKRNKIKMKFKEALMLSLNNIKTKKKRMILTSTALSIGIVAISILLSICNGFNNKLKQYESETVSQFPIVINSIINDDNKANNLNNTYNKNYVYAYENNNKRRINITNNFMNYLNKMNKNLVKSVSYNRINDFNVLINSPTNVILLNNNDITFSSLYKTNNLNDYYEVLKGRYPISLNEVVLILNSKNNIDKKILDSLFINDGKIDISSFLNKELRLIMNDDLYNNYNNSFVKKEPSIELYNNSNNESLKIVGVIKEKKDNTSKIIDSIKGIVNGKNKVIIGYKDELIRKMVDKNINSKVVNSQKSANDIVTMGNISFENYGIDKIEAISMLSGNDIPYSISIYPKNLKSKNKIKNYLDKYNEKIVYIDYFNKISGYITKFINLITIILICFLSVSILVSSVMIAIITYISVLERTREIGILRSIGARRFDIVKVFNSENIIIGILSGIISIFITKIMIFLINIILYNLTNFKNIAQMKFSYNIILILISIIISVLSGYIPAVLASRKSPIKALSRE